MKDFRTIIQTLKEYLAPRLQRKVLDKDVAEFLGVTQVRFATMKKRNVTPYEELLLLCKRENISCEVLFFL